MKFHRISWFFILLVQVMTVLGEDDARRSDPASNAIATKTVAQQNELKLTEFKIYISKIKSLSKMEMATLANKYMVSGDSPFCCFANSAMSFEENDITKAEQWIAIAKTIFTQKGSLDPWIAALAEAGYTNERTKIGLSQRDTLSVPGWKYTHSGTGYDWFIPEKSDGPTEWFVIEGFQFNFGVKGDCIMDFQAQASGKLVTVKCSSGNKYPMKEDGSISDSTWTPDNYQKVARDSRAFRFRSFDGKAIMVKAGRGKNGVPQKDPNAPGWKYTNNEQRYDWFIPEKSDGPTEWFVIDFFDTTFRVTASCLIEFKMKESDKITTAKIASDKYYPLKEDGSISDSPWTPDDFQKVAINSRAYRFKALDGESIDVKVGRRD